jgi:hypothetical protein
MADSSSQNVSEPPIDEGFVVDVPVGDFERLFCHGIPLQDRECGDLILITAKSSIYSTKPGDVHIIIFYPLLM